MNDTAKQTIVAPQPDGEPKPAQFSRRNCVEFLTKKARGIAAAPVPEAVPRLRAELVGHPGCQDFAAETSDAVIEAVAVAARTPLTLPVKEKPKAERKAATKPSRPLQNVQPSEDFLADYVRYADYLETPKEAHEIAAMMLIAAVANGNITIMNGSMPISLDLWMVILKQSGDGGNSLLHPFRAVLEAAGLDDVNSGITFGSTSHAMQHFSERTKDLIVMPEMSGTLDDWKQKHYAGLVPFITNLYDEQHKPDDKRYRDAGVDDNGKPKKTPDIDFSAPPRLCILGISSATWFFKAIQNKDFKGGFLPRFIMEWIEDSGKLIPTPVSSAQEGDLLRLAARLQQIANLKGEMRLTPEAQKRYEEWYGEMTARFRKFNNQPIAEPIRKRHRNHLLKLAAIYQLSVDPKLEIGLAALEKAIARCRQLERTIVKVVDLQLTYLGEERSEIEMFVLKGDAQGRSKRDVFRNLRGKNDIEQLSILRGLLREETLFRFKRKSKTRPGEDYVHRNHEEAYRKAHPGNGDIELLGAEQPF